MINDLYRLWVKQAYRDELRKLNDSKKAFATCEPGGDYGATIEAMTLLYQQTADVYKRALDAITMEQAQG
jgi:hypothetical protein